MCKNCNAVQDENPILRFGILRSLQEAATTATKLVTEAAINEALANNEDGKLSTKKLAAWEAQLRADHPRMKPSETTVSISLRAASK